MRSGWMRAGLGLALCAAFVLAVRARSLSSRAQAFATALIKPNDQRQPAVLSFSIADANGKTLPGRLSFLDHNGKEPTLFRDDDPAPGVLAVRRNVVYSLGEAVSITVPPGTYTVYASHGIEWSLARNEIAFEAGHEYHWEPKLTHELDTNGWASGDFHLHTYTYSGHGDANLNERLLSLVGEGVEFAVATDHNHQIDYGPTIRSLGVQSAITSTVGNEVTTSIGHFNAFPLEPGTEVVDSTPTDAHRLFTLLHEAKNPLGIAPLVQVNHPRYDGIDYFAIKHLDAVTGTSDDPTYSPDFDSVEILNANPAWGWSEPYVDGAQPNVNLHSVLFDWFHLLNRGARFAAVGNSDSHTVHYDLAGFPRNYVRVGDSEPGQIDTRAVVAAVRAKHCFTTSGPWLEFTVNGVGMGQLVRLKPGSSIDVDVRVRTASWIEADRVKLVVDGDIAQTLPIEKGRHDFSAHVKLELNHDAWVCALVEGDGTLAPLVVDPGEPLHPIAIGNPVWVHFGGDDRWISPWERAQTFAKEDERMVLARWGLSTPSERCMLLLALVDTAPALAKRLCSGALSDPDRSLRLTASRAAEKLADPVLADVLAQAATSPANDAYCQLAILRARIRCGGAAGPLFASFLESAGAVRARHFATELEPFLPPGVVSDWRVIGYFAPTASEPLAHAIFGPESVGDLSKTWTDRFEHEARWRAVQASNAGLVSLVGADGDATEDHSQNSIAYAQTWLHVDADRVVPIAFGADDAARVWIDSALVYDDGEDKRANAWERVVRVKLSAGWNHVLVKVVNHTGFTGFYFHVYDDAVSASATQTK